jgi:hypothetical protein
MIDRLEAMRGAVDSYSDLIIRVARSGGERVQ